VTKNGPALDLIGARRRMQRACLLVALESVDDVSEPAGEPKGAYVEMTNAARHLVLAQNAYDDYAEAREAERIRLPLLPQ
jgi:hypothetical protein